jgi:group I intron endonuclease
MMAQIPYKLSGIYHIKNTVNGHRYIGGSVDIKKRWSVHKSKLNRWVHRNIILQNVWDKYGEDNLEFNILLLCPREDVPKYEQAFLDNIQPDYNIAETVQSPMLGREFSEEHKKKLSETKLGNSYGKSTWFKNGHGSFGSHKNSSEFWTKERRQKASQSQKERWARMDKKARACKEETKKKISESLKGYQKTEEHKRKLSEAFSGENHPMYGKKHSEETRRKMSESQKARYAKANQQSISNGG